MVHVVVTERTAVARNAALAACTDAVIAFLEDDVVVEPGWQEALEAFWAEADERVAVAGGPLAGPDGMAVVDGPAPTYPGGNVSFRAAALRGAGGFWPARGRGEQRDWFSVEHEAQRELARMGWQSAFVPGMRARRTGAPPSLRERARTGARRQALGEPRGRGEALRALAKGLAAAVAGRRQERLGRAAENLGVLVGPRLIRRELEPVARETPFAASVPLPPRRARRRPPCAPMILLYHRIADLPHDPLGLAVSPAHWREQLEMLRGVGVVALEEAGPGDLAVTFDDGYADNLALRDAGIPITLFAATAHIEEQRPFWWDAVNALCRARAGERVEVEDRAYVLGETARRHLSTWLQFRAPEDVDRVIDELAAPSGDRPLTVDELRELAHHVSIGAHTRRHRALRTASPDEQRAEVEGSRDDLERWLGRRPTAFAYPYGVPGDAFDDASIAIVREAGFTHAVQNDPAAGGGPLSLPRHAAPDLGGEAFARWLAGLRR